MTKNPFLNALAAAFYIVAIVSLISSMEVLTGNKEDTIIIPMAMLSLFVLSAAIMSYIFLYQPLQLFLENKKKEGVDLFLKTVATFAGITVLLFLALIFFPV